MDSLSASHLSVRGMTVCVAVSSWDSHLGPHASVVDTLPTEPVPQSSPLTRLLGFLVSLSPRVTFWKPLGDPDWAVTTHTTYLLDFCFTVTVAKPQILRKVPKLWVTNFRQLSVINGMLSFVSSTGKAVIPGGPIVSLERVFLRWHLQLNFG